MRRCVLISLSASVIKLALFLIVWASSATIRSGPGSQLGEPIFSIYTRRLEYPGIRGSKTDSGAALIAPCLRAFSFLYLWYQLSWQPSNDGTFRNPKCKPHRAGTNTSTFLGAPFSNHWCWPTSPGKVGGWGRREYYSERIKTRTRYTHFNILVITSRVSCNKGFLNIPWFCLAAIGRTIFYTHWANSVECWPGLPPKRGEVVLRTKSTYRLWCSKAVARSAILPVLGIRPAA